MEGINHPLLLLSLVITLAFLLPLSSHIAANYLAGGLGPQFDLLLSSRASFSTAGTLTLDASNSSSGAYVLFPLSEILPMSTSAAVASFAGTAFSFSMDPGFEYGTLSFIISPDSNISANYPRAFSVKMRCVDKSSPPTTTSDVVDEGSAKTPAPPRRQGLLQPGRFAYVINVTHTRESPRGWIYLVTKGIKDLVLSGIRSASLRMETWLMYDAVGKQGKVALNSFDGRSPQWSVQNMELELSTPVFVGLYASAGGVFHISKWRLFTTASESIPVLCSSPNYAKS